MSHHDFEYARNYTRHLLQTRQGQASPPDKQQLNGEYEVLEEAFYQHREFGPLAAQRSLMTIVEADEAINQIIGDIVRPNRRRLFKANQLDDLPPVSWLIDQEIPERALTILFGASGSGKSFVALDYAHRIAKKRTVVYVAGEGASGYRDRVAAYNKHHETESGELYFWIDAVNLLDRQQIELFLLEIQELDPDLIIFDTLARCMVGGDENSSRDIGVVTDNAGYIQKELDTAVMLVHHTGKDGSRGARGSSAILGNADMMIELRNDEGLIRLSCHKSKDSAPFETKYYRLLPVELPDERGSCVVVPSDKVIASDALTDNESVVVEWLSSSDIFDEGARTGDLMKATEIANGTFYRVLKRLNQKGIIGKDGKYDPWVLTEYGRDIAREYGFITSNSEDGKTLPMFEDESDAATQAGLEAPIK